MYTNIVWRRKDPILNNDILLVRYNNGANETVIRAKDYGKIEDVICWAYLYTPEEKPSIANPDPLADFAKLDRKADLRYRRKLCEANICRLSEMLAQNRKLLESIQTELNGL